MIKNKSLRGNAFGIAVETTVMVILFLAGGASALFDSGGGSWQYYKEITISNSGGALSDYQVFLNLTDGDFPTNANKSGADIRFVDVDGNELSYWIENWDYANKSAKVWVKVPSVKSGSTNIHMYYGNDSATSESNGDATFDFFDDFSGDLSKWDVANAIGTWAIESGEVSGTMSGTTEAYLFANGLSIENGIVEYKYSYLLDNTAAGIQVRSSSNLVRSNYNVMFFDHAHLNKNYVQSYKNGVMGENKVDFSSAVNTYYNAKFEFNGVSIKGTLDTVLNQRTLDWSQAGTFGLILLYGIANGHQHWDDVRVRKFASPDPSVSVGAETPNPAEDFTFAHMTDVHLGYFPWQIDKHSLLINDYYLNRETLMKNSVETFTDTLQDIKSANPDRILITGDLVEYDSKDFFVAFRNLLKSIKIPVNTTPGNHDRRDKVLLGNDLSDYNTYINTPINNPDVPTENNHYFDFKGYRFIGLDSGADYSYLDANKRFYDMSPEATGLSDEQMSQLREEFNNSAPKIIFMHHPIMSFENDVTYRNPVTGDVLIGVPPDGGPGGNNGTIAFNRWNFINYSKDSKVKLVLTGHRHYDAIFDIAGLKVDNNSHNRPLFIQTQNSGYRIIEVKDGKVNPYISEPIPRFERTSGAFQANITQALLRFGLHAYDSQGRHTGLLADGRDFELGIPDSYYTGDFGWSLTPQVIVGYTNSTHKISSFKACSIKFTLCKPIYSSAPSAAKYVQSSAAFQNAQLLEGTSFNMTIEDQKGTFTTELTFYSINITERSIATVNVSDAATGYKMDLDLNGDGTTDKLINPDSIATAPAQPQNNIPVIAYNGAGTINLVSSSGNFIRAASLNPVSLNGEPPYEFPYGIFAFNISGLNRGQGVDLTITLPQDLPYTSQYWIYGKTAESTILRWYQVQPGSNDGDNVITLQLQDGGAGDDDQTANGIILNAGGPGFPLIGNVTGGGWITSPVIPSPKNNNKAAFGFVAHYVNGMPAGTLEYADDASGIKLHGKVRTLSVNKATGSAMFGGIAEIKGAGTYQYTATVEDIEESSKKADTFSINIPAISYTASGLLRGGDVHIHDK